MSFGSDIAGEVGRRLALTVLVAVLCGVAISAAIGWALR